MLPWLQDNKADSRSKTIPLSSSEQSIIVQFTGPGSTTGRMLGRRLWQPLCPAQASCALQRYLKPLLKATTPEAVLVPWVMAPWVDMITQQQIPVYLQISYPAGAICLSVVTYHPASMGRACCVSSVLGLLFPTLCCAWAIPQLPAAAAWMGTAREASGQASVHQTVLLCICPAQAPWAPSNPGEAGTTLAPQKHQALMFDQQQNTHHTHTGTQNTQAGHDPGTACAAWTSLLLRTAKHLAAGVMYCTVIHCPAREKPFHISYTQGGLLLHNPKCTRHQHINIQQFEMFSSTASPISL